MIILVDEILVDNIENEENFIDFFQRLMLTYIEGKHIIIISPINAKKIIDKKMLDNNTQTYLSHYFSRNKSSLQLIQLFDKIIRIIPTSLNESIYSEIETGKQYNNIHIDKFIDTSNFQKTILLGENGNDLTIYSMMADYYRHFSNNLSFTISLKKQTGGGSTTVNEFKTLYDQNDEFCLCILDSDKRTPLKSNGDTSKKVEQFHYNNYYHNYKCNHHIIDVLEIENLIPRQFYIDKYGKDVNKKDILGKIERLEAIDSKAIFHTDLKVGLKALREYDDPEFINYWYPLIMEGNLKCIDYGNGKYGYIRGFGDKITVDFIEMDINDIFGLVKNDVVKDDWYKIGKKLSSYIFGTGRIRAT